MSKTELTQLDYKILCDKLEESNRKLMQEHDKLKSENDWLHEQHFDLLRENEVLRAQLEIVRLIFGGADNG